MRHPVLKEYIDLCSNRNEGIVAFVVGILVGIINIVPLDAIERGTVPLVMLISMVITYFCWYGNKVLSYWHSKKMSWESNPLRKAGYIFLINGSYTAFSITIILYLFYLFVPAFERDQLSDALKWALIVGGLASLIMNMFYTVVFFFERWKQSILETEQLRSENIQAQLNALRSQVNPHFLFNSFNTLTALIEENPQKATTYLHNLSDLFRYILKSEKEQLSSIRSELKAVQLYLELQRERFGDYLQYKVELPNETMPHQLPALTLQILVENCIKHNIISKSKPLYITMHQMDDYIIIKNNLQQKSSQMPSTQLGLNNIRQRYALITNRPVRIVNDGHHFRVELPILKNHTVAVAEKAPLKRIINE